MSLTNLVNSLISNFYKNSRSQYIAIVQNCTFLSQCENIIFHDRLVRFYQLLLLNWYTTVSGLLVKVSHRRLKLLSSAQFQFSWLGSGSDSVPVCSTQHPILSSQLTTPATNACHLPYCLPCNCLGHSNQPPDLNEQFYLQKHFRF